MNTEKFKILVTGGLGTLGRPLVEELRKRGHAVWISGTEYTSKKNYVRCDVSSFRQLEQVFAAHPFDYVYHLAAEFGRKSGEEYYEAIWQTNAVGMRNMLAMQERHKFRLIYPSSAELYKTTAADTPPPGTVQGRGRIHLSNDYLISKWVNELQIRNSEEKHGTETMRWRFSSVYGPGEYYSDNRSAICIFIYHALHDMPYTVYTDAKRSFCYIDDVVAGGADMPVHFEAGTARTITGGAAHTIKQVSDMILKLLGKDDRLVEYKSGDPSSPITEDISTTNADTPSTPLEEGIAKTIEWQKKIYGIAES